jgi:hypothetical protein
VSWHALAYQTLAKFRFWCVPAGMLQWSGWRKANR